MKWLTRKKAAKSVQEPETFLVLPLLENNNLTSAMPTGVRLFTKKLAVGTWPPKNQEKKKRKKGEELQRPLTATLERPQLLNIKLISTLDMSKVRKEFLSISNLCSIPITELRNRRKYGASDRRRSIPRRPLSLPNNELKIIAKSPKRPDPGGDESWEDDESTYREKISSKYKKSIKLKMKSGIPKKQAKQSSLREKQTGNDSNNNASIKSPISVKMSPPPTSAVASTKKSILATAAKSVVKPSAVVAAVDGVFGGIVSQRKVPEPCKTCGRPDQPERFHSHPITPVKPKESVVAKKIQMKSTVQKPVAIKFKSKKSSSSGDAAAEEAAPTPKAPTQKATVKSPAKVNNSTGNRNEVRILSAGKGALPRMLTCYLCGREFGSASLPLHEPKCLEKWERENSQLPASLRRKAPTKPDKPFTTEEWNEFAWKASQASLTPCKNCARTFLPDRLLVHLRSCKPGVPNQFKPHVAGQPGGNPGGRQSISNSRCQINSPLAERSSVDSGGRRSRGQSIGQANSPFAERPGGNSGGRRLPKQSGSSTSNLKTSRELFPDLGLSKATHPNPASVACQVCGKMFGSKSIGIHEPQCLKKWHQQNDHLPPDKREPMASKQPEPPKNTPEPEETTNASPSKDNEDKSPMFPCYLCGRLFDVHHIYGHEPLCLQNWREENDKLPPNKRRQEPMKPDIKFTPLGTIDFEEASDTSWQNHLNQLVPCNICGRKFTPDRVEVHERSCKGQ